MLIPAFWKYFERVVKRGEAMSDKNRNFFIVALALAAAVSSGCTQKQPTAQQQSPAPASQPQAAAPAPAPVPTPVPSAAPVFPASSNSALATSEGDVPGLKIVINELKRTSNTVTLKFTVYNGTDSKFSSQGVFDGDEYHRYRHLGGVHLIDTQSKKKYFVVTDSDGKVLSSTDFPDIAARSQIMVWAKFPAPPDDVQKITVEIPHFIPLEDVPISR
jgi:hypothetical protein